MMVVDGLVGLLAFYATVFIRFFEFNPFDKLGFESYFFVTISLLTPLFFLPLGVYEEIDRQGVSFFRRIFGVSVGVMAASYFIRSILGLESWPRSLGLLYFCISTFGYLSWRLLLSRGFKAFLSVRGIPVIVYGAGDSGQLFAYQQRLSHDYFVLCFVDDDPEKHGIDIDGIRVHPAADIALLVDTLCPAFVILAFPSLSKVARKAIITRLSELNLPMQTLSRKATIDREGRIKSVEDVDYEDLIEGPPMESETVEDLARYLSDQTVLVTGAGGTIGGALCEYLIRMGVKQLIALDQSELGLYHLSLRVEELSESRQIDGKLVTYMGSVGSRELVRKILRLHRVNLVLHAAAYKHVGLVEKNIGSGIENNVFGTRILLEEVIDASDVHKLVLVSSDKAVRPTNVMGATKRLAEILVMRAAKQCPAKRFGIVRFGNVIGSSGSVVPKFLQQIKSGKDVTVTHRNVVRYFMTPDEAAGLILLCSLISERGEVYLLDMGEPVKIVDLARQLINLSGRKVSDATDISSTRIVFSGLGVGEKMYEELLIDDGRRHPDFPRIFVGFDVCDDGDSFDRSYANLCKAISVSNLDDLESDNQLKQALKQLVSEYTPSII